MAYLPIPLPEFPAKELVLGQCPKDIHPIIEYFYEQGATARELALKLPDMEKSGQLERQGMSSTLRALKGGVPYLESLKRAKGAYLPGLPISEEEGTENVMEIYRAECVVFKRLIEHLQANTYAEVLGYFENELDALEIYRKDISDTFPEAERARAYEDRARIEHLFSRFVRILRKRAQSVN